MSRLKDLIVASTSKFGATTAPHASALIDIESTTKGFLPPRMTTAQRDLIGTPGTGLAIYNTSTNAINYYNGTVWTALASTGSTIINVSSKTSNYTLLSTDDAILANAVSGGFTLTLPASSSAGAGKIYQIKKIDSSANLVTIARSSSNLIDGETSQVLAIQHSNITLLADGSSNYYIL